MRLRTGYQKKLKGCVDTTIAYLRSIGKTPLEPVLLTRASWNEDARVSAFFARADDVPVFDADVGFYDPEDRIEDERVGDDEVE